MAQSEEVPQEVNKQKVFQQLNQPYKDTNSKMS